MKPLHDVHVHNYLSSCCSDNSATVGSYLQAARENGIKLLGFANHTWDESVPLPHDNSFYPRQSMAFEMQIKSQIPEDTDDLKVLVGAETEYCGMYDVLGMGREAALQLDFLLIPHTHVHMRDFVMPRTADMNRGRAKLVELFSAIPGITPERAEKLMKTIPEVELEYFIGERTVDYVKYTSDFMIQSFRTLMENETLKSYSDDIPVSIAHPFQPVGSFPMREQMLELISDNTYGELFQIAAKRGIGLEINGYSDSKEALRLYGIAKECGCKFTFGSDMHTASAIKNVFKAQTCIDHLGLTEEDLMDFVRI